MGTIVLTLRLCRWPMKSHVKVSGQAAALRLEILGAVLADQRDAGLREHAHLLEGDVLRRRADLHRRRVAARLLGGADDPVPHALEVRPYPVGVEAPSQLNHATPACRPVAPPSRRWEKNRSAGAHSVHRPLSWTSSTPAAASSARATAAEVEMRTTADGGAVGGEGRVDLLPHLVAARTGPRTDRRRQGPVVAEVTQGANPLGDDPAGEPPPAAVEHRDGTVAGHGDRQAVRDHHGRRDVGERGRLPVGLRRVGRRGGGRRR